MEQLLTESLYWGQEGTVEDRKCLIRTSKVVLTCRSSCLTGGHAQETQVVMRNKK